MMNANDLYHALDQWQNGNKDFIAELLTELPAKEAQFFSAWMLGAININNQEQYMKFLGARAGY